MTHLSAASTSTLHTIIQTLQVGVTPVYHKVGTCNHLTCLPVAYQSLNVTNLLHVFPVERLAWYCSVLSCSVSSYQGYECTDLCFS